MRFIGQWRRSETGRPSTSQLKIRYGETDLWVYLRSREGQPWEMYVCGNDCWSDGPSRMCMRDIFEEKKLNFPVGARRQAENAAENLVEQWLNDNWEEVQDEFKSRPDR
jgi:hypothetical protein